MVRVPSPLKPSRRGGQLYHSIPPLEGGRSGRTSPVYPPLLSRAPAYRLLAVDTGRLEVIGRRSILLQSRRRRPRSGKASDTPDNHICLYAGFSGRTRWQRGDTHFPSCHRLLTMATWETSATAGGGAFYDIQGVPPSPRAHPWPDERSLRNTYRFGPLEVGGGRSGACCQVVPQEGDSFLQPT
jgi:hypothetical protein